jgi:hypothetical protein
LICFGESSYCIFISHNEFKYVQNFKNNVYGYLQKSARCFLYLWITAPELYILPPTNKFHLRARSFCCISREYFEVDGAGSASQLPSVRRRGLADELQNSWGAHNKVRRLLILSCHVQFG